MDTHPGQQIRRLRLEQDLSVRALARRSKVAIGTIHRIEKGKSAYDHTLSKLAAALGVDLSALIADLPKEAAS